MKTYQKMKEHNPNMKHELLKELLCESYSGDYTKIAEVIKSFLLDNTDAEVIEQKIDSKKSNVIAVFGKPKLVINCHMDTVAPAGTWKTDPFRLTEKDGKIYGLGTCDTKGNIYAVLKACENSKPKNLMLLFSVDEESGVKTGVSYFLESKYCQGIEKAVVCEPTELKFVNRHKGYYSYDITAEAEPMHSSQMTAQTRNAIAEAAKMICRMQRYGFNIGTIEGGERNNIVADRCEFTVSIRGYQGNEHFDKLVKRCTEGARVKVRSVKKPFNNKHEMPFCDECSEAQFWTEGALFQEKGIDTVVFGAGDISQAHSQDEYVAKDKLLKAQKMLEKIIIGNSEQKDEV